MKKIVKKILFVIGLMASSCVFCSVAALAEETPPYQTLPFHLQAVGERIVPVDMNGDGLPDLLVSNRSTLSVYLQKNSRPQFDFSQADILIELPGTATGWDIDYIEGRSTDSSEQRRILAVVDGKKVLSWVLEDSAFSKPQVVLDEVDGFLPPGFYPLRFVQDVNSDGFSDFLVPTSGKLRLFTGGSSGTFSEGMDLSVFINESANVFPSGNLLSQVGGRVDVGNLTLRDVNNDGHNDIVSQSIGSSKKLFVADSNGHYSEQPSLESELDSEFSMQPEEFMENIDNLSALVNRLNFDDFADINGDEQDDYVVKEGNKVSLYFGSENKFDLDKPDQILKSSGNLLAPFFYDEDGDGQKDLVLLRLEDLSLSDLILKAVFATNIKLENYVYRNKGNAFATRPHRKVTITLDLPALIKLPKIFEEFENKQITRLVVAALDEDRKSNDILVLRDKTLVAYKNIELLEKGEIEDFAEAILGVKQGKDEYTFDINDLGALIPNPVLLLVENKEPDVVIPIELGDKTLDLSVADFQKSNISNDKKDDFFVFTDRTEDSVSGYLLISE